MLADTILVIDDEPQIRRVVKSALANEVSSVLEAGDGAEGLAVATAERPTLVVLDLGLPDMAGIDVC
ncbi:MAG: response regulator, partial [Gemmatimonadaceae bacterium]|nr:response regulator [Gemmatimonadaceae bacterium]